MARHRCRYFRADAIPAAFRAHHWLPVRIAISAMGIVVAMLSVTGVVIWYCKRRARML